VIQGQAQLIGFAVSLKLRDRVLRASKKRTSDISFMRNSAMKQSQKKYFLFDFFT